MKDQPGFESIWLTLQMRLQEDYLMQAWSQHSGYTGGLFRIYAVGDDFVKVELGTGIRHVPKKDFENLYSVWDEYIYGKIKRYEIREITRHSTYIISIFHYLKV